MADNGEKRNFKRIPFACTATLYNATDRWECKVIDLSLKGILLEVPEGWQPLENANYSLDLVLKVSEEDEPVNRIHMFLIKQVHHEKNLVGFKWENIDIESFTHLRKLLEINLGDYEEINREIFSLGE